MPGGMSAGMSGLSKNGRWTNSTEPEVQPTYETRDGVNFLYWRHRGHGYYIVGGANKGWMWSLKNDIAYQLKAM